MVYFIGWTIDAGQSAAQISTKIPNETIAGIIYWLLLILIVGICVAGTGILAILIEIKVIELYTKNCWDVITLLMILTSASVIIFFWRINQKNNVNKSSIAFYTFAGSICWT